MKIKFLFKKVNFVKTIFFTVFLSLLTIQYSSSFVITKKNEHIIKIDVDFADVSIVAAVQTILTAVCGFNYFLLNTMIDTVSFVGADFIIRGLNEFGFPMIEICYAGGANNVCYKIGNVSENIGFNYLYPKLSNIILNKLLSLKTYSETKNECREMCLNNQLMESLFDQDNALFNNICSDFKLIKSKYLETKKIICIINCLNIGSIC